MSSPLPTIDQQAVINLWFHRQGLSESRGTKKLNKKNLTAHLENTGAIQLDSVNVVDRAHYLTMWSRFGNYSKKRLDDLVYRDRIAYEYWGHEASLLPISHLPIGRRRMLRFPPESFRNSKWWCRYETSPQSKRRVINRLRKSGPLESADFEKQPDEFRPDGPSSGTMPLQKEDNRTLQLLWHSGKVAIHDRRHFRRQYDLAERIYPNVKPASLNEYFDSWLLVALNGCGVAPLSHLRNYLTGPSLKAPEQKQVIERNLKAGRIVEVRVSGRREKHYALPEHLVGIDRIDEPTGTNLICPFDSLLFQRKRAEDLLDFYYRIEIYVPEPKRQYGYYVLPILHNGKLVGRIDPKHHRNRKELEIKAIHLEEGFKRTKSFDRDLGTCISDLAEFLGTEKMVLPKMWRRIA